MESNTYTMPSYWAPYLINGDSSHMYESEITQCNNYVKGLGACVGCSENPFFGEFKGVGHELLEFTFLTELLND